ncbi:MAG: hypothetical protein IPK83_19015 [Planctomycetes bacterium]|nr:hypothetical protein [Planctomycetota bacterium]
MGPTIQKEHVQAVSSPEGVLQFFARLDYNVSEPADQTAASLGLAERVHHMVRQVRRITMLAMGPGLPAGLEIYWIEATHLTADLRKAAANAFRNKPANTFLLLTTREFSSLEFVLIEKASAKVGSLSGPSVSHRLLLVDRGNPRTCMFEFSSECGTRR